MAYIPPTDWELRDFYREHADTVYRSCMLFTNAQADCRAMMKEIFLKLLDKGMEFTTASDAKAWMILSAYKMRRKAVAAAKKQKPKEALCSVQEQEIYSEKQTEQLQSNVLEMEPACAEEEPSAVVKEDTQNQGQNAVDLPETEETCDNAPVKEPSAEDSISSEETVNPEDAEEKLVVAQDETASVEKLSEQLPSEQVRQSPEYPAEIASLSSRERLVAVMYYCEGFRKTEIASYLGCTIFGVRRVLKRIGRKLPGINGGLLLRVFVRDAYQQAVFSSDDREVLMEELVDQRLKTTDRRSRKWSPKGQWGSWLLTLLFTAAILCGLYYGAEYLGIMDMLRSGTEQVVDKLEEMAPAEDTLPPQTEEVSESTLPPVSMEETYDLYVLRYMEALEQAWDPGKCMEEDISLLVGFLTSPDQLKFTLVDIDQNGIEELIITDGRVIYDLYTYADGEVKHVLSGAERNAYMLSVDNVIINYASGSAAYSVYGFYRFVGSTLVVDQLVVLDAAKDPQHPWFRGFIEEDLHPITEEEANQIIESYENMAIDGTPLYLWRK